MSIKVKRLEKIEATKSLMAVKNKAMKWKCVKRSLKIEAMKRLILHHLALLFHRNHTDSKPVWIQTYLMFPDFSGSKPMWFLTFQVPNLFDS